ncbi:MAG TPA: TonB family protein, partial [Acidobacteriota bacterium]|nr:TonB family protein [Acidobacteriota bacterium]
GKKTAVYAIVAAVLIVAVAAAFWMTKRTPESETQQPDASLSLLRKLAESRAKPGVQAPTVGTISVTSTPAGAKVFLGQEEKGVTPLSIPDVPFGKYTLKFQLKGYQELQQEVELTQEKNLVELPATLQVVEPVVGILTIESTPPGAFIVLGSRVLGVTPRTLQNVNAGKYNVTLKMDGFHDYTTSVRIKDKETTTISAKLEAIPKPVVVEKPKEEEVKPGSLVSLGGDVIAPKAIKKTNAKYPNEAKSKRLSGTVKLSVLVSETGKVIDIKIVQSAHPLLDGAAIASVKEWVYEPAKKRGIPVKVWVPVSMSFVQR